MFALTASLLNLSLILSVITYKLRSGREWARFDVTLVALLAGLLPTIFGINWLLFNGLTLPWGLDLWAKESILETLYIEYYLSWILTFIIFTALHRQTDLSARLDTTSRSHAAPARTRFDRIVILALYCVVGLDLALISELPGVYILAGDITGAELAKGRFVAARFETSIPIIGYVLRFFPIFGTAWAFHRYIETKNKRMFLLSIIPLVFYSAATLIKSYALLPLVAGVTAACINGGFRLNLSRLLKLTILGGCLIILPFYAIFGGTEISLLEKILSRIFIVQVQGAWLIRSIFDSPDPAALLYGAPLLKRFGIYTMDPASEVLNIIWGPGENGFVNINSHYIGQGFVMFGNSIWFIGPIIIALNFVLLKKLTQIFQVNGDPVVSRIIAISVLSLVPFNNNFGNAVYLKASIAFMILLIFVGLLIQLAKVTAKNRKKGQYSQWRQIA